MVNRTALFALVACAGLGPVAAGVVIYTRHASPVTADRVAPWGGLTALAAPASEPPVVLPQAVKVRQILPPPDATAVATVTDTVPARAEQVVASADPALVQAAAPPPAAPATPDPVPAPAERDASVEVPPPAVADTAASDALVDINSATVESLNHIPGVGRIGRAIASHRPYRSVDELVSRRILRSSDFQRVKDKLKV